MTKRTQQVIGPSTTIDLLEFGIKDVPAKIDTGADSSAIWASNVYEHEGVLFFTLFGPGSPYYTGETVRIEKYSASNVKNSFGHSERRYKIQLKVAIADKIVNANFTLANREANTFPVLIGRKTVHGRFIIDVSRREKRDISEVLVLSSKKISSVSKFFAAIEDQNPELRFTLATYDDLEFTICNEGTVIRLVGSGRDVTDFDAVYFKTFSSAPDFAAATAHYLEKRNVLFFDKVVKAYPPTTKLLQYVLLQKHGIAIPKSVLLSTHRLQDSYQQIIEALGSPFILKDIYENKGRNNFLVKTKKEFAVICKDASEHNWQLIAQQFVPNKGDYRLVVIGKQVELAMLREGREGSHLNNTALEGEATLVQTEDLPKEIVDDAIRATELLDFTIAGADFVQDNETKLWYCLEINDSPQLASGAFVEKKQKAIANYLQKKLKNKLI
jgi:glutathione synthase/RimK-type ligase-like ATP-grasp enzyme